MSDAESFDAGTEPARESPESLPAAGSDSAPVQGVPHSETQAKLPGKADAEGWRRLHPLSPVLRGGLVFLIIVGVIITNLRDRLINLFVAGEAGDGFEEPGDVLSLIEFLSNGGWLLLAIGGLVLVVLVVVALSWISWRFHTYRVTTDAVESRAGVLFRQHRRAPLDRVQSVNLQRSLLARAVGLTKVEVQTGGQGGKVELAYLGYRDAKTAREQILRMAAARRAGGDTDAQLDEIAAPVPVSFDGTELASSGDALAERAHDFIDLDVDPEARAAQTLVRVPVPRLLGSIALSWEAVTFLLVLVAILGVGIGSTLNGFLASSGGEIGAGVGILATAIPIVLIVVSVMFAQFNKGFNFTLSRGRDSVRIGAGLTATTTDSIPFGRIHAIEARQPLLWRPFGWWKVRVTLAGLSVSQGGQNSMQNVVLPVGHVADVQRVIDTLTPGVSERVLEDLLGNGDGFVRAGRRAGWVLWWGKRRAGIRIDDPTSTAATLRIRRGFLTRSLSIMPIVRAQSVLLARPLVHRMIGLASVQAHTVLGPVRMEMRGLDLTEARHVFDDLAATVLRVQAAEAEERHR